MDENLASQIQTNLLHLGRLMERGQRLGEEFTANGSQASLPEAFRSWQQECGAAVGQLSGGSKAHWLAAAYSDAFLVRSRNGNVEDVAPAAIIQRILGVLAQAADSLQRMAESPMISSAPPAQQPRRFGFVRNAQIRPVLEEAYIDAQRAFEQEQYTHALITYCSILETLVTDALEDKGTEALAHADAPGGPIGDWPFLTRLQIAEKTGLIRGGWVRLPEIARRYREVGELSSEPGSETTVSEVDAKRAGQVLHVVMRDLNPGR